MQVCTYSLPLTVDYICPLPDNCISVQGQIDDDGEQYEVDFLAKGGWLSGEAAVKAAELRGERRAGGG